MNTVSRKAPTLASCSFDNHGLILIILGKQHQHTFSNDMHIHFSVHSLLLKLRYLLLHSCDGNDTRHNVFSSANDTKHVFLGRLLVALKRAGGAGWWLWNRFSLSSIMSFHLHACAYCFLHWPRATASSMTFCDMLAHESMKRCCKSLTSRSGVLYRRYCISPQIRQSTGFIPRLFGGYRSGYIKSCVSCWRSWTVSRALSCWNTKVCFFSLTSQ